MISFSKIAIIGLFSTAIFADTIDVQVMCSNGQSVPNLSVAVIDSTNQGVPGVLPTDFKGVFQIPNSELFTPPFFMAFDASDGSTCGFYMISIDPFGMGHVDLNYYPENLPCSCSKLVN